MLPDKCETCGSPIYPAGVSYTGQSCMYRGRHPRFYNTPKTDMELLAAVKELTVAVQELSQRLPQTGADDE